MCINICIETMDYTASLYASTCLKAYTNNKYFHSSGTPINCATFPTTPWTSSIHIHLHLLVLMLVTRKKVFPQKTSISIIQLQTTTSELTTPLYMNSSFLPLWVLYIFELSHFQGYICSSSDNYTLRYLITGQEIHFVPLSRSNFWDSLVHRTCNQFMLHHFT